MLMLSRYRDFMVVRESGELISHRVSRIVGDGSDNSRDATIGAKPLAHSQEKRSKEDILKLTSKIIHMLTGEVRRFVGHGDGRIEDPQPARSLNGSSKRNSAEGCPHPLYSRDSTEEEDDDDDDDANQEDDHEVSVISIKVEDEEDPYVMGDEQREEKEIPPELSSDGSSDRNTPERCPRPRYSSLRGYQAENLDNMKVVIVPHAEDKDDEMTLRGTEVSPDPEGKSVSFPTETLGSPHQTLPASSSNQLVSLEGKIYVCYECGKCAVYDTGLQEVDTGKSSLLCCGCDKATPFKPFLCVKCGRSFSSKMVYMAHQGVHTGGQSFPCGECGLTFSNKSILETHQSIHTGDRPFSCSDCGKCFAMKANLVKHLKVHKGEKPFACQDCGKSFSMKSNLVKHQRIHTGEKPFECTHCGKTFGMKSNLVKHQRIHTGEKPFKCLECSKCFASRSNLATHEKIHTGEKPFVCSFCGKGFITSSDLSRHQKTHTGERPFVCSDCGRSFISKFILNAHQKSHTGDMPALAFSLLPGHLDSS